MFHLREDHLSNACMLLYFASLDLFLDMFVINIASLDMFEIPLIYIYVFIYILYVYINKL